MFTLPRISSLMVNHQVPEPCDSPLLRDAIAAYESAKTEASEDRDQILPNLVQTILGWPVDYLTFIEDCADPVAVVNGLIFRGDADDAYQLKNGWLTVATRRRGCESISWREVHSIEHLGQVAKQFNVIVRAQ